MHSVLRACAIMAATCLASPRTATPQAAASQAVAPPVALWRIDCGGAAAAAPYGPAFIADQPYTAASRAGFLGGSASTWVPAAIGGLTDPFHTVHRTARFGWQAYRFDVQDGDYLLRLHFAEIDKAVQGPGLRRFSLMAEGAVILSDFDPAAQFGVHYAAELVVPVHVSDGRLDVGVVPGGTAALLNAIEVWSLPASPPPLPPVVGLSAKNGYGRTIVSWKPPFDPAVAGFLVERSDSAHGPWSVVGTTWAAPPRFLDDGDPSGTPRWYRVRALGALGPGASGPAPQGAPFLAGPAQAHPPEDSSLPVFELAVSPADLQLLDAMVVEDEDFEVPAVFTHAGLSQAVSVRYRGEGSLLASKKSWKVDFPESALFEGRSKLNLKATFLDESLSVEPLAHGLFESVGHAVSHQRRVHLRVNGVYRGVFNDIEQVDEHYLAARDCDPGGSLYKGVNAGADFALQPDLAGYQHVYEKKTQEQQPYDDLVALIELVNTPGTTPLQLADVFDVDAYLSYLAVVGWDGDSDQLSHNFYLLHDPALERWEWITWDNDRAMFSAQAPIAAGTSDCESCSGINHLKELVLADPGLRWRYAAKLAALMQGAASPAAMQAAIAARHAELLTDAHADVDKLGWELDTLFDAAPAALAAFASARNAFLASELARYQPPAPPTAIWINEFMADNRGTLADEAGQFEDWLELYNADAAPRDVGGLYLTDDLSQPTQWRIPDGTQIAGHGRLLVWCDDDAGDGPLHASFKLSAEGEELGLIAADGLTLLDVFHWRQQLPDVSQGRETDGAAFFRLLPTPTPGLANSAAGNLPPSITWVEHAPALPVASQPVKITAQVVDATPPLAVTLLWRTGSSGPFATLPMTPLPADRWQAVLPPQPASATLQYYLSAQDGLGALALEPTDAPESFFAVSVGGPPPGALRINEVMADNTSTLADEAGSFEDWVEIANDTDTARDLAGMSLTDDPGQPLKWLFPAGTLLPPHGTLLVWADEDPQDGPLHADFKLSKSGETVALFDTAAHDHALLDALVFGPQLSDVSTGLLPDGHGVRVSLLDASPGDDNLPPPGATRRYDALAAGLTSSALSAATAPLLGQPFALQLQLAPGSAAGLLVIGLGVQHIDLGANGVLLLNPLLPLSVPFTTLGDGSATIALPLPGNPALTGLGVTLQAYVSGGGLSNAVAATLGG